MTDSIKHIRDRKFIFCEKEKDLGKLDSTIHTISVSFLYHNTTNRNLLVQTVKGSCGCMDISYPEKVIYPQDKGNVIVKINLDSERGYFRKTARIYFHGMEDTPVSLIVKGEKVFNPSLSKNNLNLNETETI